jgi:hypothetical protein
MMQVGEVANTGGKRCDGKRSFSIELPIVQPQGVADRQPLGRQAYMAIMPL